MSRAELEAWLRLLNLEFSPSKVRALLGWFGIVEAVWCASRPNGAKCRGCALPM
jgi:hypothetical protein